MCCASGQQPLGHANEATQCTLFNAFNYLTDLTDEDNNNDVAAITADAMRAGANHKHCNLPHSGWR